MRTEAPFVIINYITRRPIDPAGIEREIINFYI